MRSAWQWMGLALVLAGALAAWDATVPIEVAPMDAAAHEGQRVRIAGVVTAVADGGEDRFTLVADGAAIDVRVGDAVPVAEGEHVSVVGRLGRVDGRLALFADAVHIA
jgi:hypothetical protein